MKKVAIILMLAVVMVTLVFALPVQAGVTQNVKVPVTWNEWVPCANGGLGEWITANGTMHILYTYTSDNNSGYHMKMHWQPQKLQGIGLTTGDKYNAVGVTQDHQNIRPPFPVTYTSINNYRMIGQGRGNNFMVHETYHVTVNANGNITANVTMVKISCK